MWYVLGEIGKPCGPGSVSVRRLLGENIKRYWGGRSLASSRATLDPLHSEGSQGEMCSGEERRSALALDRSRQLPCAGETES